MKIPEPGAKVCFVQPGGRCDRSAVVVSRSFSSTTLQPALVVNLPAAERPLNLYTAIPYAALPAHGARPKVYSWHFVEEHGGA